MRNRLRVTKMEREAQNRKKTSEERMGEGREGRRGISRGTVENKRTIKKKNGVT